MIRVPATRLVSLRERDVVASWYINARHFLNLTWVSRPIAPRATDEADLFAGHWGRHGR